MHNISYAFTACLFLPEAPPEHKIPACTAGTLWPAITEGHLDEARGLYHLLTAYFAAAFCRLRCTTLHTYSLYAYLFLSVAPPEDEILACTPATLWAAITEGHPDEARGFILPTNGMICCCICSTSLHNMFTYSLHAYLFLPTAPPEDEDCHID